MFLRLGLVFVIVLAGAQISYAGVTSMSLAKKSTNQQGLVQQVVVVKCSDVKEPRSLIKIGAQPWCDSQVSSLCSRDKLGAAKDVCSGKYNSLLEKHLAGKNASTGNAVASKSVAKESPSSEANVTPVNTKSAVTAKPAKKAAKGAGLSANELAAKQKELLDIEQQKVQIRQRQLELRKRELELQKQRVSAAEAGF